MWILYLINIANIQGEIPLQGDFSAEHMIFGGALLAAHYMFSYIADNQIIYPPGWINKYKNTCAAAF